jgi:hypothetical protein
MRNMKRGHSGWAAGLRFVRIRRRFALYAGLCGALAVGGACVGTDCAKHGDVSSSKTASIDVNQANAGIVSMMSDSSCSPAARPVFACRCSVMSIFITHQPKTAPDSLTNAISTTSRRRTSARREDALEQSRNWSCAARKGANSRIRLLKHELYRFGLESPAIWQSG